MVLVGEPRSGKTRWVRQVTGQAPCNLHVPTLGVEVRYVRAHDGLDLDIWDTGSGRHAGLKDGYYIGGEIGVVFGEHNAAAHEQALMAAGVPTVIQAGDPNSLLNRIIAPC